MPIKQMKKLRLSHVPVGGIAETQTQASPGELPLWAEPEPTPYPHSPVLGQSTTSARTPAP